MSNLIEMPSRIETYREAAVKEKPEGQEIVAESEITQGEYGSSRWTTTLIRKYLRPYSLGPGPTKWGRAKNRYRLVDIDTAWMTVPPAIRRERDALLQGYDPFDNVEEYLAHEAEGRINHETWESAAKAVDIDLDQFPCLMDWMDIVRRRRAALELTVEQIAAVERIPNWTWEIGSTGK